MTGERVTVAGKVLGCDTTVTADNGPAARRLMAGMVREAKQFARKRTEIGAVSRVERRAAPSLVARRESNAGRTSTLPGRSVRPELRDAALPGAPKHLPGRTDQAATCGKSAAANRGTTAPAGGETPAPLSPARPSSRGHVSPSAGRAAPGRGGDPCPAPAPSPSEPARSGSGAAGTAAETAARPASDERREPTRAELRAWSRGVLTAKELARRTGLTAPELFMRRMRAGMP